MPRCETLNAVATKITLHARPRMFETKFVDAAYAPSDHPASMATRAQHCADLRSVCVCVLAKVCESGTCCPVHSCKKHESEARKRKRPGAALCCHRSGSLRMTQATHATSPTSQSARSAVRHTTAIWCRCTGSSHIIFPNSCSPRPKCILPRSSSVWCMGRTTWRHHASRHSATPRNPAPRLRLTRYSYVAGPTPPCGGDRCVPHGHLRESRIFCSSPAHAARIL